MQKTGQIERTVDREFAEEEGRYRTLVSIAEQPPSRAQDGDSGRHLSHFRFADEALCSMEKETNNLQRDAKTYLDAMRGKWTGLLLPKRCSFPLLDDVGSC